MYTTSEVASGSQAGIAEKRRFRRFDCYLNVTYATGGKNYIQSKTLADNIGVGGMRIKVSRIVKKNDSIKFSICQPGTRQCVYATGVVRWVEDRIHAMGSTRIAGVQFTDVEPFGIERIVPAHG